MLSILELLSEVEGSRDLAYLFHKRRWFDMAPSDLQPGHGIEKVESITYPYIKTD